MTDALPVIKGTLDVLVLKALSLGPMHGFEITRWLESRSGSSLEIDDSALYQALYRMEGRGLIEAEWGVSEKNRRVRVYQLTRAGRAHLKSEAAKWQQYASTMNVILATESK